MSKPDFENVLRHVVFYGDPKTVGSKNIPELLRRVADWFDSQDYYNYEVPHICFENGDDGEWLVSVTHGFANITLEEIKEKLK